MKGVIVLVAVSVGGGIGWWLGALIGLGTAIVLSAVGSALAVYYIRRLLAEYT